MTISPKQKECILEIEWELCLVNGMLYIQTSNITIKYLEIKILFLKLLILLTKS